MYNLEGRGYMILLYDIVICMMVYMYEGALLSGSHTPAERGLPFDVSRFRDPTVRVSASFQSFST